MYLHSYYLKNKEKISAKSAARYERCKEQIREQHKARHKIYKNTLHGRYTIAKQMVFRLELILPLISERKLLGSYMQNILYQTTD